MGEKAELRWRRQGDDDLLRSKLELPQGKGEFSLRFGFFRGGDLFAEAARMTAIECPGQRVFQRASAEVLCEHRRPRDRLQRHPMRAIDRQQRDQH